MFSRFGKYRILEKLGRGGMGDVYLTIDTESNRRVALKLVQEGADRESHEAVEAEERGARLQQRLCRHTRHVPTVYEYGRSEGHFYIAMEYVEGRDLAELIGGNPLPVREAVRICVDICKTLHQAHSLQAHIRGRGTKGIIHGDIKPKNIRLGKEGEVILLDFGIAKGLSMSRSLTHSDFGSLEYCSPERLETGRLDLASDLWSVGVVLYEMVSGRKPFEAATPRELERRICSGAPPAPLPASTPRALSAIIRKALAANRENRYARAADMMAELKELDQGPTRLVKRKKRDPRPHASPEAGQRAKGPHKPTQAEPPAARSLARRRARRRLFYAALVLLVALSSAYAYGQYAGWLRPRSEGAGADAKGTPDPGATRQEQSDVAARGGGDGDASEVRRRLKEEVGIADAIINQYPDDGPAVGESGWGEASSSLVKASEIAPDDASLAAKRAYCDGHLSRLRGTAERSNNSPAASDSFKQAETRFKEAAASLPQWADPHLALAVIYTYYLVDFGRADRELDEAERLGRRSSRALITTRADALRLRALRFCGPAERAAAPEELRKAKDTLLRARGYYQQLFGFGSSQKYIDDIDDCVPRIERRINRGAPEELGEEPEDES